VGQNRLDDTRSNLRDYGLLPLAPFGTTTIRRVDVDDLAIEPLGANESVHIDELVALYDAVGWSA
jgi:hypothetical protein